MTVMQIVSHKNNPAVEHISRALNDQSGATTISFMLAGNTRLRMTVEKVEPEDDGLAIKGLCSTGKPVHVYFNPQTGQGSAEYPDKEPMPARKPLMQAYPMG